MHHAESISMYEKRPKIRTTEMAFFCFSGVLVATICTIQFGTVLKGEEPKAKKPRIDATTLNRKVLCGYQGWFRCPGDLANEGWRHWSRNDKRITANSLTFEMWPDMTEYADEEKYPV